MTIAVTDSFSNRPEHIVESAKVLGQSEPRRRVYIEVYRGQARAKTVDQMAANLGLSAKTVLSRGRELEKGGLVTSTKIGGKHAYAKIPAQVHIRDKVLAIAGNKARIEAVPTKRSQPDLTSLIFVQREATAKRRRAEPSSRPTRTRSTHSQTKIAFLTATPLGQGQLNIGLELRQVEEALLSSEHRDKFDHRLFPGSTFETLADALSRYKPDIVHFSGHGGAGGLVFDKPHFDSAGGHLVQFPVAQRMIAATGKPPMLVVLNACATSQGSDVFLATAKAVVTMANAVDDLAAGMFSKRFYSAIFAGENLSHAVEQARTVLQAYGLPGPELPELQIAAGIAASELKFIV